MMNPNFRLAVMGVAAAMLVVGCSSKSKDQTPSDPKALTVTVTAIGSATGSIESSPAGIDCDTSETCLAQFAEGQQVTLTPSGGRFFEWGGACAGIAATNECVVNMTTDLSVSGTFAPNQSIGDSFVLTSDNQLASFNKATPESLRSTVQITGLATGENLLAMDFFPVASPVLYALGSSGAIYEIDHTETDPTVAANPIAASSTASPFVTIASGVSYGMDFDAADGRLHIIGDDGSHQIVDDVTATAPTVSSATAISGAAVSAVAYTHNYPDTPDTVLLGLDVAADTLVVIDAATGVTRAAKALGRNLTTSNGFDVIGTNLDAYAAATEGSAQRLFQIDVSTGTATLLGSLFISGDLRGLAVLPTVGTASHLDTIALNSDGQLFSFAQAAPGTLQNRTAVVGLNVDDTLVAADFRPVDGQLYGIGLAGNIYAIDPYTGLASAGVALNGASFGGLSGASFGFAIDPEDSSALIDGGVIVSASGQFLTVDDLDAGTVSAVGTLSRGGNDAQATDVAFTNAFFQAQTTTAYVVDSNTDVLATLNTGSGALTNVGALSINVSDVNALYINPRNGSALGAFRVGTETRLYGINLGTGATQDLGLIGDGSKRIVALGRIPTAEPLIYAVLSSGKVIGFNPSAPDTLVADLTITGLGSGESLVALDYRVADGVLYGMTGNGRVYRINTSTGAATQSQIMTASLNDPSDPFTALEGTAFSASFDPTKPNQAAAYRVVSEQAQNLRVNVSSGETFSDADLTFTAESTTSSNPCDHNSGSGVRAMGYSNRFADAVSTSAYVLDLTDGATLPPIAETTCLYRLTGVESNTLTAVGALSSGGTDPATGLTITGGHNGAVYFALTPAGTTQSDLRSLNLGDATDVSLGLIGTDPSATVLDMTVVLPARN